MEPFDVNDVAGLSSADSDPFRSLFNPNQLTIASDTPQFTFDNQIFTTSYEKYSWRAQGWMTGPYNQIGTGTCVSNSCCRMMEAVGSKASKNWLLEATQFHYCALQRGVNAPIYDIEAALLIMKEQGIPARAPGSFVPPAGDWTSSACPVPLSKTLRLERYEKMVDVATIKQWIAKWSPVVAVIQVGEDFDQFGGTGAFVTETGPKLYHHAVPIVGFDNDGGYWILQNSKGAGWGDKGYAKLAYGSCRIFSGGVFVGYGCTME